MWLEFGVIVRHGGAYEVRILRHYDYCTTTRPIHNPNYCTTTRPIHNPNYDHILLCITHANDASCNT